ncbi:MAG: hypothetical protein M5U19_12555 [Microthrixaceae bacterium]|nr:hypothetical protein [Microthrixaceae bacterium]
MIRVEQLYPWPKARCWQPSWPVTRTAGSWCGSRRSPRTWDPGTSSRGHSYDGFGDRCAIQRVSRSAEGSPATGSHAIHLQEQEMILHAAFEPF